jgi:hypothetical protein
MQVLRGALAGAIVGGLLYGLLVISLHAIDWLAAIASVSLGLAILAVVGTGRDERGAASDAAWSAAAPDLPPASDRAAMEQAQIHVPSPPQPRKQSGD